MLVGSLASLCVLSCAAPRGGWDVGALADRKPELERYSGHRLGDLVPFPVLGDGDGGEHVRLVACRFATGAPVSVRSAPGAALGGRATLVAAATRAVSERVPGLALRWSSDAATDATEATGASEAKGAFLKGPAIWVQTGASGAAEAAAARGGDFLGDTRSECDVGVGMGGAVRGTLLRASIRMRSRTADNLGRPREATEAEWLGALMHELGHAVGFIGHVVSGDSLMVREQSTLRRWGRRIAADRSAANSAVDAADPERAAESESALESERAAEAEPTLAALYMLSPGEVLGERLLAAGAVAELQRLRALQAVRLSQGARLRATVAMAGDRDARIEWRYSDGSRLGIWFRGWVAGLRAGGVIEAELDLLTRRALIAEGL